MRHTLFLAIIGCLMMPPTASAQDAPRFGIVMGYPAQVGLLWNISDRMAIRPELSISKSASETNTTISIPGIPGITQPITASTTTASSGWQTSVGASALFYLTKGDALRTYAAPRYAYSRVSSTVPLTASSPIVGSVVNPGTISSSNHSASGSIGAQYTLG